MPTDHTNIDISIDPLDEDLIALCDLPSLLPRRRGKKVAIKTVRRWALKGVGGRVLPTIRVGSMMYTSPDALRQFMTTLPDTGDHRNDRREVKSTRSRSRRDIARERVYAIFGISGTKPCEGGQD